MTSEADEAIGLLTGFMKLPQAGQLPTGRTIRGRALMPLGFLFIQHATAQTGSDADHAIEFMCVDEAGPLSRYVFLVLCRHRIG